MKKLSLTLLISAISLFSFGQTYWLQVGSNGVNGYVNALDSANGLLFVGGNFTSVGIPANHIASWNGSSWSALDSGVNGNVAAIIAYNGNIIAGGSFTKAGTVAANNIAMWNGTSWSAIGSGIRGGVTALGIYKGNLIVSGNFDSAGGVHAKNIVQWNGTSWDSLANGIDSAASSMVVYESNLCVGGEFKTYGAIGATTYQKWNGSVWSVIGSATGLSNTWQFNIGLAVFKNKLYIGTGTGVGTWNDTVLSYDTTMFGGYNVLYPYEGYLIGGGDGISSSGGLLGNGIYFCVSCITALPEPYMYVYAIAGYKGVLYAGGQFVGGAGDTATIYGQGNYGGYIEQFNGPLSVNQLKAESASITVYPNPSTGIFTIKSSVASNKSSVVEVYNMLGEKVYSDYSIPTTQYQIDLSRQSSGIYLYRIIGNDGTCVASGKLVKE